MASRDEDLRHSPQRAEPAMSPDDLQRFLYRLEARLNQRIAERLMSAAYPPRRTAPRSFRRIVLATSAAVSALALLTGLAAAATTHEHDGPVIQRGGNVIIFSERNRGPLRHDPWPPVPPIIERAPQAPPAPSVPGSPSSP